MKERRPITINLEPKTERFLEQQQEKLNVSQSNYINDLLILAIRIKRELKQCPQSYVAINVNDSEITPILTHTL